MIICVIMQSKLSDIENDKKEKRSGQFLPIEIYGEDKKAF